MTPAEFRAAFPEFGDVAKYPDATIIFWSGLGVKMLNKDRWGAIYVEGLMLYTAHYVTIAGQNARSGAVPGNAGGGAQSQKAVGKVSVSNDTASVTEEDAGQWNATNYGRS
jgi:hypothetical protein